MERIEAVRKDNLPLFLRYVTAHGPEHDGSFLPDTDFVPSPERPSYLALLDSDVVGVVSLMRTPRYVQARRGRFAILHAPEPHSKAYPLLFSAIQLHFEGLRDVYLFLPEARRKAAEAIRQLGFSVERYSFVMKLGRAGPTGVVVPDGLTLRPIRRGEKDLFRLFADAINRSFAELAGHIPMVPEALQNWVKEATCLEDGYTLLLQARRVVGTVGVLRDIDEHNAGEVVALSVSKEMRHQGLGRLLLRHAVCFATGQGLGPIFLSLNAENSSALRLYHSEGFVVTGTMVCYSRDCSLRVPRVG
jgi:mycothiol synthase